MAQSRTVLIACGGTGGHLFPGIAVAEALLAAGHQVRLLISEKQVDAEASAKYQHLTFVRLPAIAKPATFSLRMAPFVWRLWRSVRRCRQIIRDVGADAVVGMGGFTSLPPVYAGHRLGCKTFVHDSNARPGRANVLTSRFCDQVLLGLAPAAGYFPNRTTQVTGTPVRPEILHLPSRFEAANYLGLDPNLPTVLVTGGSQGARRLNELVVDAARILGGKVQVLHVAGGSDHQRVLGMAASIPHYHVIGFCDRMAAAYAVCDVAIARAGASSLSELAIAGLPAILVPFPFAADDHQTRNAEVFAAAGAARLRVESELRADNLAREVVEILDQAGISESMAAAARRLAVPDAAVRICRVIESAIL